MTPGRSFGGDVIRRASRTTAALQLFAVLLLAVLVSIYFDISNRQSSLQDAVRENAMWSVYQFDREANELRRDLETLQARGSISLEGLQHAALRYDIIFSRLSLLKQSQFEESFSSDDKVRRELREVEEIIYAVLPVFDQISAGTIPADEALALIRDRITTLGTETSELLIYTNTKTSTERAQNRSAIERLQRNAMIIIGLLAVSVVFLIVNLRRQLRGVQAAGASLEAMAEQLSVSFQAAEAGNRAKSQFMATMGHEIRTPLNAILGMVELLELDHLPPSVLERIRIIRRSGEALLDIINEILDYAKIEHGKLELEERPVDLSALAESAVEMMRGRATEAGNRIHLDLPHRWHARCVSSDPTRLRQVILNLMSNAVKFTNQGTVTLRMRQINMRNEIWLRVEVQDTGIGISEAGREKLFRPFSQVDASISRQYGGTGLGLTICKEIIDRFGGRIGVESATGLGSQFWFEVPVRPAEDAPQAVEAKPASNNFIARSLKILVAEDNKVNQQVIIGYLHHLGQNVTLAENGLVAVQKAQEAPFDLVLMDMQMPVMDGIEAARNLRASHGPSRAAPIIALTANASEQDREACLQAGMNGFRSKPITLAALSALLQQTIETLEAAEPVAPAETSEPPSKATDAHDVLNIRRQELEDILGEDAFEELLQAFFDDAEVVLRSLAETMETENKENIDKLLHNLKGAASNIGFTEIAALAQSLRQGQATPADIRHLSETVWAARTALAA